MAPLDLTRIKLGPGAQILEDAPENQELLAQIQHTEPATTTDLFKLALFYQSYSTNRPLAAHLARLAIGQIIGLPPVQEALKGALFINPLDDWPEIVDQAEDWAKGYDRRDPEDKDQPQYLRFTQTPLWVLYSGIGLLIEKYTRYSVSGEGITHYYVIGDCPNPAGLIIQTPTQRNL
jgi:hypothetical protein